MLIWRCTSHQRRNSQLKMGMGRCAVQRGLHNVLGEQLWLGTAARPKDEPCCRDCWEDHPLHTPKTACQAC